MPRKGENIRKRKDGRWEGRYRNGVKADGTYRYSSVYGKSYSEVKNKLVFTRHEAACFRSTYVHPSMEIIRVQLQKLSSLCG